MVPRARYRQLCGASRYDAYKVEEKQNAPDDHLRRFARAVHYLPLELVAFCDAQLLHGANVAKLHI